MILFIECIQINRNQYINNRNRKQQLKRMFPNFSMLNQTIDQIFNPKPIFYNNFQVYKKVMEYNKDHQGDINYLEYQYLQKGENYPSSFYISSKINKKMMVNNDQKQKFAQNSPICIIYVHGYSSFCMEGLYLFPFIAENTNVSLCIYDLRCHGKNQRQGPVTFGLKQSEQLKNLIQALVKKKKIQNIILWGRSMGASTCLQTIYGYEQKSKIKQMIKMIVLDSPFISFESIAQQLINRNTGNAFPKFITNVLVDKIVNACLQKYGIDLRNLNLLKKINGDNKLSLPKTLFVYSKKDEIISSCNSSKIIQKYMEIDAPYKQIVGNFCHNQQRPDHIITKIFAQIQNSVINLQRSNSNTNLSRITLSKKIRSQKVLSNAQNTMRESQIKVRKGIALCSSMVRPSQDAKQSSFKAIQQTSSFKKTDSLAYIPQKNQSSIKFQQQSRINRINSYKISQNLTQIDLKNKENSKHIHFSLKIKQSQFNPALKMNLCENATSRNKQNFPTKLSNAPYLTFSSRKPLSSQVQKSENHINQFSKKSNNQPFMSRVEPRYAHRLTPKQMNNKLKLNKVQQDNRQ